MRYLLHITHTHVETDARIMKELEVIYPVATEAGLGVAAIGLDTHAKANAQFGSFDHLDIRSLRLAAGRLPRWLMGGRHLAMGIETLVRFVLLSFRLRPAVVHVHDALFLPIAWLISLMHRAPLVYDAHELESDRNGYGKPMLKLMGFFEKLCWSRVRLFISVSAAINEWYEKAYGPKTNIVVLNSPVVKVDPAAKRDAGGADSPLRSRFGIAADRPLFVYLGILAYGRGLVPALEAFSRVGDEADFVCVGWGEYEKKIAEAAAHHPNIHLHEPIPHDQVVSFVADADFGVCLLENVSLSYYLALPNKVFEYAFAGLPILASNFPELSRVIAQHDLGTTCEPEVDSIVQGIRGMLARGQDFQFKNLDELSWHSQAQKLRSAYRDLPGLS